VVTVLGWERQPTAHLRRRPVYRTRTARYRRPRRCGAQNPCHRSDQRTPAAAAAASRHSRGRPRPAAAGHRRRQRPRQRDRRSHLQHVRKV